jgi:hypothetical protein
MKSVVLAIVLAAFASAALASPCGTNSGKRYYNGKCV